VDLIAGGGENEGEAVSGLDLRGRLRSGRMGGEAAIVVQNLWERMNMTRALVNLSEEGEKEREEENRRQRVVVSAVQPRITFNRGAVTVFE